MTYSTKNNKKASSSPQNIEEKSRILVCDDSKLVRVTAKKMLGTQFDLILLEDGAQAWESILADPKIQLVFTDLGMPNLDGYGLIERVRNSEDERIRNLPMIVITGASEDEKVKKRIYDIGATDFVTKPFTSTGLIARAKSHTNYVKTANALRSNVSVDLVTDVLNRRGFDEKLVKDLSFVKRHNENLAVAIFELDNFEDLSGRIKESDQNLILKAVAKVLTFAVRKEDSVARDRKTRFLLLLPMAKIDGVVALTRRLSTKINKFNIEVDSKKLALTTSVGIASLAKGQKSASLELIQCAEKALTNARALGPNEVQFLKVEHEREAQEELEISIDSALEQLAQGKKDFVIDKMDAIALKLAPLLSLMNKEQKQRTLPSQD